MIRLFEYGQWSPTDKKDQLKRQLQLLWSQRFKDTEDDVLEGTDSSRYQPFLSFDDDLVRANNYVGYIQNDDEVIEIYPKVFKHLENPDPNLMLRQIFFWLSYCRKWRFPFNTATIDHREIDSFPEMIIHLMANQMLDVVATQPMMQYQMVEEALLAPRGSVNFNRYTSKSLSRGNFHQIECDYEPFLFDNTVNRIIKYCARLLLNQTRFAENQKILQDVVFILDEVEDVPCSLSDLSTIKLNTFYDDYLQVMETCKSILGNQLYSHQAYDASQWCLLFPMEYIFEDFVAGFLETHFSDQWKVKYQKSDMKLVSKPEVFTMQHDIFLTSRTTGREIIVDTKYKVRVIEEDNKLGVSQSDLYQVVSYAYRRGCTEVILIYPNRNEELLPPEVFEIESGFGGKDIIKVKVVEIPFWSNKDLNNVSDELKDQLKKLLR